MPKRMRVFYDTEFLEDGKTVDLISIGMVRADGKEYYAVSNEFDTTRVANNPWLMENVMNSIPHESYEMLDLWETPIPGSKWMHLTETPDLKSRKQIKDDIIDFVSDIWPEFWAWYGAYDHVALCQLFGRMIDLPKNFPMFTCDIKQEQKRLGIQNKDMPQQEAGKHNALDDARYNKKMWEFVDNHAKSLRS